MTSFPKMGYARNPVARAAGFAVVALLLASCAADSNLRRVSEPVSNIAVGSPGEVSAMTLASAMLRAGFTREEILELGPGIRRSLAHSGGAQARRQGEILALFSFSEGKLYVTSASSGTFVMDA
jgi:hypothetical protein